MAKGNVAKDWIAKKISEIFTDKVVKIEGSKIYINAQASGEDCQICLNMTCPKVPVEGGTPVTAPAAYFSWDDTPAVLPTSEPPMITEDEQANIAEMMRRLGL